MAREHLEIGGTTPHDEDCSQVGQEDYSKMARIEGRAFINQLKRMFPKQTEKISLSLKSYPHDFGSYYEVVASFDDNNEEQVEAAYYLENHSPKNWDEKALEELAEAGYPLEKTSGGEVIQLKQREAVIRFNEKKYPHLELWKRASNYSGSDFSDYYPIIGRSRDSQMIENFNYEKALEWLNEEKEKLEKAGKWPEESDDEDNYGPFTEESANHWAVGWVEQILVRYDAPESILVLAEEILKSLEDYPILDDSEYSEYEYEQLGEVFENNKEDFMREVAKYVDLEDEYMDDTMSKKDQEELKDMAWELFYTNASYGGADEAWVRKDDIENLMNHVEKSNLKDNKFYKMIIEKIKE